MSHINMFYWELAVLCCLSGLLFFFITAESIVRGKLRLPAWVFSSFTLVIGVFFFRIFINSLSEFSMGRHISIDQLLDAWRLLTHFVS